MNEVSPGTQLLASLVSRAKNEAPIPHVLSAMTTSNNNMTVFVFRGAGNELDCWCLKESNNKGNKHSLYSNDEGGTNQKKGLRVRLPFNLNEIGMMVAMYISITGITKKELPKSKCPSGIYIMKIPGLCLGGECALRLNAPEFVYFTNRKR